MKRRAQQLGVGVADITAAEKKYVNDALDSNRLSYGKYSERLEREFAAAHDMKYAIFTNSGTSALQVGLHAMKSQYGWQDGDEVIVPAVTFVASSNTIIQNGLKPVFVDVDPKYYELDPTKIEDKITDRTVAIMPVHLCGQPCDMDPIMAIAKKHDLRVIEDSCETMFVKYKGRPTGSWGDVSCFSTYVAHLLVTGVGGFALTNDDDLAIKMKSLFNHGRDSIYLHIDDDKNIAKDKLFELVARRFRFIDVGYSYRCTELEAALGVGEMERKDEMLAHRKKTATRLTKKLKDLEEYIQLPAIRPKTEHAFMFYPLVVQGEAAHLRDKLIYYLEDYNVETRGLLPLTNQPIYLQLFGADLEERYPEAKRLNHCAFYIGCHPAMTEADVDYVSDVFHQFFETEFQRSFAASE